MWDWFESVTCHKVSYHYLLIFCVRELSGQMSENLKRKMIANFSLVAILVVVCGLCAANDVSSLDDSTAAIHFATVKNKTYATDMSYRQDPSMNITDYASKSENVTGKTKQTVGNIASASGSDSNITTTKNLSSLSAVKPTAALSTDHTHMSRTTYKPGNSASVIAFDNNISIAISAAENNMTTVPPMVQQQSTTVMVAPKKTAVTYSSDKTKITQVAAKTISISNENKVYTTSTLNMSHIASSNTPEQKQVTYKEISTNSTASSDHHSTTAAYDNEILPIATWIIQSQKIILAIIIVYIVIAIALAIGLYLWTSIRRRKYEDHDLLITDDDDLQYFEL